MKRYLTLQEEISLGRLRSLGMKIDDMIDWDKIKKEPHQRRFWFSIQKASRSLFSRRNGYRGKLVAGYSICLRLFNRNIL